MYKWPDATVLHRPPDTAARVRLLLYASRSRSVEKSRSKTKIQLIFSSKVGHFISHTLTHVNVLFTITFKHITFWTEIC